MRQQTPLTKVTKTFNLCGIAPDERPATSSSTFTFDTEIHDTKRKEPADPYKPDNLEDADDAWTEVPYRKKRKKQAGA